MINVEDVVSTHFATPRQTHRNTSSGLEYIVLASAEYLSASNSSQHLSSDSHASLTASPLTSVDRFAEGPVRALLIRLHASYHAPRQRRRVEVPQDYCTARTSGLTARLIGAVAILMDERKDCELITRARWWIESWIVSRSPSSR